MYLVCVCEGVCDEEVDITMFNFKEEKIGVRMCVQMITSLWTMVTSLHCLISFLT